MIEQLHLSARRLLITSLLLICASLARAEIVIYDYEIVNSYPHNTRHFTQGLLVHDGYLYEGTGQYGESALMKIDMESGEVLQRKPLGRRYFGEGIAIANERIYQLTWRENMVFVHDLESFDSLESHYLPTEGWGLTWDGEHLILSDGSDQLYFYDPATFQEVRRVTVSIQGRNLRNINELEYINGEVWANVWTSNEIVRIDPETGIISSVVDLRGLREQTQVGGRDAVLNGIAWDEAGERLLVTGKLWAHVFEIELRPRD